MGIGQGLSLRGHVGAKGKEGDWVAGVGGVAAGAVVNVDIPGWGITLDAVSPSHPAEWPDGQPIGVCKPEEAGFRVDRSIGVLGQVG